MTTQKGQITLRRILAHCRLDVILGQVDSELAESSRLRSKSATS